MIDYAAARRHMVDSQLRTNRVTNEGLIEAFLSVPRERFVPEDRQGIAYMDEDIPIGHDRYLMEPMVLARMLEMVQPRRSDIALDLGCGTGYATAILARLVATVVAVESEDHLVRRAGATLADLSIDNTVVVKGELTEGYPAQAPYDIILVNGAADHVPDAISGQLAEGGRLVTVLREGSGVGRAYLMRRSGDVVSGRVLFDAAVPFLAGFEPQAGFVF